MTTLFSRKYGGIVNKYKKQPKSYVNYFSLASTRLANSHCPAPVIVTPMMKFVVPPFEASKAEFIEAHILAASSES